MTDPFLNDPRASVVAAVVLAVPVVLARAATLRGCLAGASTAAVLAFYGGRPVLVAFGFLVVVGTLVSRLGRARKRRDGTAQADGGRRSARHVLANAGPAVVCVVSGAAGFVDPAVATAAACGAFAGNLADTASGELGMLFPRPPRLLLFGPIVRRGTNGGMTWPGLLSGIATGGLVAVAGADLVPVLPVLLAACAGTLADSVIGAFLEGRPGIDNETVNFASGLVAAVTAGGLA